MNSCQVIYGTILLWICSQHDIPMWVYPWIIFWIAFAIWTLQDNFRHWQGAKETYLEIRKEIQSGSKT